MEGTLVQPQSPSPQKAAEKLVPLGWCNPCISQAKAAEKTGVPRRVNAAVTLVAMSQTVAVPGTGNVAMIVALPACWECIGHGSGLIQGVG